MLDIPQPVNWDSPLTHWFNNDLVQFTVKPVKFINVRQHSDTFYVHVRSELSDLREEEFDREAQLTEHEEYPFND